tara:strand:- start:23202 stop:23714 length:513 start_codon:yes stop_codon:yes gene_type:complete
MKSHIFIIGMMGTGKSTIASLLSKKLNIPFIDTDKDLEDILNLSLEEFFKKFSEKKFRELESTYFVEHVNSSHCIYATGGGIIINKKNRNVLKNYGRTILLNASIETIIKRLENDSKKRPLFTNKNALENIWDERKHYYHQCSDIIIDTDNKEPQTIAKEIIKKLIYENK